MADLLPASGSPVTSPTHGLPSMRRPTAGPTSAGSPSAIRGPRVIMQERAAREARQRAEAEKLALERSRAEQEARLLEESRRREAELRSAAAVAAAQGNGTNLLPLQVDVPARPHLQSASDAGQTQTMSTTAVKPSSSHHRRPSRHAPTQSYATADGPQPRPPPQQAQQPNPNNDRTAAAEDRSPPAEMPKPRNSFPHAFERWETLSAHWEGLTSYWIRKLEQNKDEVNRDPLNQQLARQVTDLSAAGANLFHAVVELQRLRASSERKFQRWFFETRAELERAQEINAMLEVALQKERSDRADAIREAIEHERGSSKLQKQLSEMRRELTISKEEARRAWEELGRREQEERERTYSLQTGQPTLVGGVQVVPMTQGNPRRQASGRDSQPVYQNPQEYEQGFPANPAYNQPVQPPVSAAAADAGGQYYLAQPDRSEHGRGGGGGGGGGRRGPETEGKRSEREYGEETATGPAMNNAGEQTPLPGTLDVPTSGPKPPSTPAEEEVPGSETSETQDYTGQGYGTPGWETAPRHHHPTRLSDVIEEDDERSRTSASQVSRG